MPRRETITCPICNKGTTTVHFEDIKTDQGPICEFAANLDRCSERCDLPDEDAWLLASSAWLDNQN